MSPSSVSDHDASSAKYLRGKYAICGVGETTYRRGSEESTRSLATWAITNAMNDAGMKADDIDGMLSYSGNDSTFAPWVAGDLGIRLNFYMDVHGGGSSTEALIGSAMGVIEAGLCKTVAIYRAMNGYSAVRIGGTGRALRGTDPGRPDPPPGLWLAKRRADVRADIPASHVRLRHHAGADRGG